jgi:hypothetical protein
VGERATVILLHRPHTYIFIHLSSPYHRTSHHCLVTCTCIVLMPWAPRHIMRKRACY